VIGKKKAKQIKFFVIMEFSVFVFMKIEEDVGRRRRKPKTISRRWYTVRYNRPL